MVVRQKSSKQLKTVAKVLFIALFSIAWTTLEGQQKRVTEPFNRYCKNRPSLITSVCRSENGVVWLSTSSGLYRYTGNEAFADPNLPIGQYSCVREIAPDLLAMIYNSDLIIYNTKAGKYAMCKLPYIPENDHPIYAIEQGFNDTLFIINRNKVSIAKIKNDVPYFVGQLPTTDRAYYFEYEGSNVWLVKSKWAEEPKRVRLLQNHHASVKGSVISAYNVYCPFASDYDIENCPTDVPLLFYFSTFEKLPPVLRNALSKEVKWKDTADILISPEKQNYRGFYKDRLGYWWILTNTGLFLSYPSPNNSTQLLPKMAVRDFMDLGNGVKITGADEFLCLLNKENRILKKIPFRVYHMYKHNEDSILLSSEDQFTAWFTKKDFNLTKTPFNGNFLFHGAAPSPNKGKLIIYGSGVLEMDIATGHFHKLLTNQSGNSPIFRCGIRTSENTYLLGGSGGLFVYNRALNKLKKVRSEYILHITSVHNNLYAIGTLQQGAMIIDSIGKNTNKISHWPFEGPTRNAFCLVARKNELWTGTGNGLVRFNILSGTFTMYNKGHGSESVEYNTPGAHQMQDGFLWFAGLNGISIINPDHPEKTEIVQHTFVDNIKYFKGGWHFASFRSSENNRQEYLIPSGVHEIEFEPCIQDFLNNQFYEVQYRISSLSQEWISVLPYQSVRISNLSYGTHSLEMRILDLRNRKTSAVTYYNLKIDYFWYQSVWARLLLILLIGLLIWMLVRLQLLNIRKKANAENEKLKAEIKTLSAQIDPHFVANLMTSAQARILGGSQEEALEVIDLYGKLMRKKFEHGHKELTDLGTELELVENYIKVACIPLGKMFNYRHELNLEKPVNQYTIPTDIIQPIVENTFKHAWKDSKQKTKELSLKINAKDALIFIEICDNGTFANSLAGKDSRKGSLDNIKQRLRLYTRLYNGEFKAEWNADSFGTVVKIVLDCSVFNEQPNESHFSR